jgi:DNA polymerase
VTDDGATRTAAIPTLHPAFLLRQPAAKRMFWNDLLAAAKRLEEPGQGA